MLVDVFVSYSSKDKPTADAVCAALEAAGIRCWIAPRDILPGQDWGAAIVDAIDRCRAMVLVFSADANDSPQIRNEVVQSVNRGIPVIPVRIADIMPTKALAYFMGSVHWLDALTPPLEKHLETLASNVNTLLQGTGRPDTGKQAPLPSRSKVNSGNRRKLWFIAAGVAGVVVVMAAVTMVAAGFLHQGGEANVETVQVSSLPTADDLQRVSAIAAKNQLPVPAFTIEMPKGSVSANALRFVGIWASSSGYNGTGRQAMLIVTAVNAGQAAEGYFVQGPPTASSATETRSYGASSIPIEGKIDGGALSFAHASSDTKFIAKFDINNSYLTMTVTLHSGLSIQIVLNPVWTLVKCA
ncbi:MAG: toll/interleukin-1 receptor domain-containing protein [Acidocella sp.]|nr:toll/interleukin-1 receptor domain-containing protein [Acidocella sp.]